jgi:hypothetical protein
MITSESLAAIAAAILSLLFSYVPGLNVWFAALKQEFKRLIMAGLLLVVSIVFFYLGCQGILVTGIDCTQNGVIQLVWIFVLALMANQSTYQITPLPDSVRSAAAIAKRLT